MKQVIFFLMLFFSISVTADENEELLLEQEQVLETTVNTLQNLIEITEEKGKAVRQTLRELNKQTTVIH